jgi:hypothetical protein
MRPNLKGDDIETSLQCNKFGNVGLYTRTYNVTIWRIRSILIILETFKTQERSVKDTKCVFYSSLFLPYKLFQLDKYLSSNVRITSRNACRLSCEVSLIVLGVKKGKVVPVFNSLSMML